KPNASGGYKRAQSHLRHILTKKSSKRKRQLGELLNVHANDERMVRRMLPYS
ncbi:MAG: 50S ribosomal protein L35, partial [Gammaproteobacteria bacterium]|nr:50S ribosomal protein L35 [Gammaproteobacteria bacterium]